MLMVFVKKVVKRSFKHNALIVANLYIFIDNTNDKKNIFKRKLPFIAFNFGFNQHKCSQNRRRELLMRRNSLLILLGPSKSGIQRRKPIVPSKCFLILFCPSTAPISRLPRCHDEPRRATPPSQMASKQRTTREKCRPFETR